MDDMIVRVLDFDTYNIGASVAEDEDGFHTIYVNARWGYNGQKKALEHELDHIEHDDFRNGVPLDLCEYRARKNAKE